VVVVFMEAVIMTTLRASIRHLMHPDWTTIVPEN
jgi:hypothetical protein